MIEEKHTLQKAFSGWKMFIAIALGVSIAAWMVWNSLQETHYIAVESGGTHTWNDLNHNEVQEVNEFQASSTGTYRQQTVRDVLQQIDWRTESLVWLGLAFVFMIGRDVFYMIRIRILTQKQLSWRSSFHTIMLWEFASALSPGVMSGAAVAMFILNREKIPLGRSTAIVVITAMMDNLFYILLIPFVFLFVSAELLFPSETATERSVEAIFWIGYGIFFLLCVVLFASIFFYPKLVGKLLRALFSLPGLSRWKEQASQTGREVELTSIELKKEGLGFWLSSFGATIGSWMSRYLVINCLLATVISLSVLDHFFVLGKQLVLWLFMRMSPTPGGSGVAEYAFGELMSTFTNSALLLAGLAVVWRLISYFPYLFIGAIILPRWIKKTRPSSDIVPQE